MDENIVRIVGESEMIRECVHSLGMKTFDVNQVRDESMNTEEEDGVNGEEGVSVSEKNGILGIVLEVVEGGGWKGGYEELEEVVSGLEEEGEKEWRDRKKKRRGGWMDWREMGRLSHALVWEIERRKRIETEGESESGIVSLGQMQKKLLKSV